MERCDRKRRREAAKPDGPARLKAALLHPNGGGCRSNATAGHAVPVLLGSTLPGYANVDRAVLLSQPGSEYQLAAERNPGRGGGVLPCANGGTVASVAADP